MAGDEAAGAEAGATGVTVAATAIPPFAGAAGRTGVAGATGGGCVGVSTRVKTGVVTGCSAGPAPVRPSTQVRKAP